MSPQWSLNCEFRNSVPSHLDLTCMRSTVILKSNTWKLGTSIEVTAMGLGTKRPSVPLPPTPLFIVMTERK